MIDAKPRRSPKQAFDSWLYCQYIVAEDGRERNVRTDETGTTTERLSVKCKVSFLRGPGCLYAHGRPSHASIGYIRTGRLSRRLSPPSTALRPHCIVSSRACIIAPSERSTLSAVLASSFCDRHAALWHETRPKDPAYIRQREDCVGNVILFRHKGET